MKGVIQIPGARVPIVKFTDPETFVLMYLFISHSRKLNCDICINNPLGVFNSKLIRDYSEVDSRFHEVILHELSIN